MLRQAPPALSVCCFTRGPTARVAAGLALLRDVADEIVVALDDRVGDDLAGPLVDVADTVVAYPYADPVDRPVGWIHGLCRGRWILNLDDDEVPSAALVDALPSLVAARDVTHYHLPRRWLFGDAGTYLDEWPWRPDYQPRLVLNDPRLLWFPGVCHWPIQAVGPHRYLHEPILHAVLLLTTVEERRARVAHYERSLPGRRIAGRAMNQAYYLPEDAPAARVAALPPGDAATMAAILAGPAWPDVRAAAALRHVTRAEIDARWHGRPVTDETYRARLAPVSTLGKLHVREQLAVDVLVWNDGDLTWPWGELGRPEIRLSYRWVDEAGAVDVRALRTPFPHAVPPGGDCLVAVDVVAPERPGRWTLELDLVHEHVRWFGATARLAVDVRPVARIAVLGGGDEERLAAARAVVEGLPEAEPVLVESDPGSASARLGYAAVAGPRDFLLAAGRPVHGRFAARAGLLGRSLALLTRAAARRVRHRGASADPPGLDALASFDALLVAGPPDDVARERWQQAVSVTASRVLGLPVVHAADPEEVERLLADLRPRVHDTTRERV